MKILQVRFVLLACLLVQLGFDSHYYLWKIHVEGALRGKKNRPQLV